MVYFVSYKAFLIFIYRRIRSTSEKPLNCYDGGRGDSQQPHNHFHYEKTINVSTTKLTSARMLLYSNHFSYSLFTVSNSPTDDSELHSVFHWSLSKNRNHQSKTDETPSRVRLEHHFTKFISIMKNVGQPNFG